MPQPVGNPANQLPQQFLSFYLDLGPGEEEPGAGSGRGEVEKKAPLEATPIVQVRCDGVQGWMQGG